MVGRLARGAGLRLSRRAHVEESAHHVPQHYRGATTPDRWRDRTVVFCAIGTCRFLDTWGHGDYLRHTGLDFGPGITIRLNKWAVPALAMPTARSLRRHRRKTRQFGAATTAAR